MPTDKLKFQRRAKVPKMSYSTEEKEVIINRAKDYMQRKPDAPRTKVATYAGVAISVLENWGVELPKPITAKQRMKKTPWGKGQMI